MDKDFPLQGWVGGQRWTMLGKIPGHDDGEDGQYYTRDRKGVRKEKDGACLGLRTACLAHRLPAWCGQRVCCNPWHEFRPGQYVVGPGATPCRGEMLEVRSLSLNHALGTGGESGHRWSQIAADKFPLWHFF